MIVQYGGGFRGLKILRAQEVGAVGVIIYTDPIEDGEITKENGFEPYPDGPARQPSSFVLLFLVFRSQETNPLSPESNEAPSNSSPSTPATP